ncbi:hypothetical protein FJ366_01770 [Candidatus Dependentiae bacterium]|nr:hypothetical protein [Candidatus Dependentiae bacterium]
MSTNLSVSFELICLMGWLLKKDKHALRELIQKALSGGVADAIYDLQASKPAELSDTMEKTVSEFFEYVESILAEGVPVNKPKGVLSSQTRDAIKKVDQHVIDPHSFWNSVNRAEEAVEMLGGDLNQSAREAMFKNELYKNILSNWTVPSEDVLN